MVVVVTSEYRMSMGAFCIDKAMFLLPCEKFRLYLKRFVVLSFNCLNGSAQPKLVTRNIFVINFGRVSAFTARLLCFARLLWLFF